MLIPNPFYAVYAAGAVAADCEPVYLDATAENGFLPDLDALSPELLARTVAFYLASPANPQGSIADAAYLKRLIALARQHRFMVFADECYSEIYWKDAPPGMLEQAGERLRQRRRCSTRSRSAPACPACASASSPATRPSSSRSSTCARSRRRRCRCRRRRSRSRPMTTRPMCEENQALYRAKFDLADQIIGNRYGYKRPAGGFFLWLDVSAQGGSEAATLKLWKEAGLRVLPGKYAAREQADGFNPGENYIRIAMVQDREVTAEALHRLVAALG